MQKKNDSTTSNTKIAIVFFIFLVFIVGVSLAFKLILVIKQSQFDDSRRFTLAISNKKNVQILSLTPNKSAALFKLDNNIKPADAGRFLEIPIDATLELESLDLNEKVNSIFFKIILNYKDLSTNLTSIDLLRLFFVTRTIPESSVAKRVIPKDLNTVEIDKIVGRLIGEELVEKDDQTIRIINGTDISGLGNRLARLITNMGGDVIIVATSEKPEKVSKITYIDKKTYTVERLAKVLGYTAAKIEGNFISDITIIIGKDKINSLIF